MKIFSSYSSKGKIYFSVSKLCISITLSFVTGGRMFVVNSLLSVPLYSTHTICSSHVIMPSELLLYNYGASQQKFVCWN